MHASKKEFRRIAIIMDWAYEFARGTIEGVRQFAASHQEWALKCLATGDVERARHVFEQWRPDGVIVHVDQRHGMWPIIKAQRPIVSVLINNHDADAIVDVDNFGVGVAAAREFIMRGFTSFAFLGIAGTEFSQQREMGFRKAIQDRHLQSAYQSTYVSLDEQHRRLAMGSGAPPTSMIEWLKALPKSTAVFVCNDHWALDVLEACRFSSIRVPEDLAIIGADDDEMWCQLCQPQLSSVIIPWRQIGWRAAETMEELCVQCDHSAKTKPRPTEFIAPGEVRLRESSTVLAVADPVVREALRYIAERFDRPLQVPDLSRHLIIDRRALERRFAKAIGRSPLQEIHRVRVERAKMLLTSTDLPTRRVAQLCGFSTKRFAETFRKLAETNPAAYRRRFK